MFETCTADMLCYVMRHSTFFRADEFRADDPHSSTFINNDNENKMLIYLNTLGSTAIFSVSEFLKFFIFLFFIIIIQDTKK